VGENKIMATNPWEDYQEEEDGPWNEYDGLRPESAESNILYPFGLAGKAIETYIDAPTRSAIGKLQEDVTDPMAALKAAWEQVGQEPSAAPSGEKILKTAGLPEKAAKVLGMPIEMAASPLNILPISSALKMISGAEEIKPLSLAAKESGAEKALKQAGAMKAQFKEAIKKDQVVPLGEFALKEKIVKAGSSVEDAMSNAEKVANKAGKEIQNIYNLSNEKVPVINQDELISPIIDRFNSTFKGKEIGLKESFDKLAPFIQENIINKTRSLEELWSIRKEVDDKVKWAKTAQEMPAIQLGYKAIRDGINDLLQSKISNYASEIGGEKASKLLEANNKFSKATKLYEIAENRASGLAANRAISPSDYGMGIGGGILAGLLGGGKEDAAIIAAGSALANKLARTYGPGYQAKALMGSSKLLKPFDPLTTFLRQYPGVSSWVPITGARYYRQKALED
jgi:hypothetical protein